MKLKWLRTVSHVGYTGHRPLRKITIERWCIIKRCSHHSIPRIQQRKKKRQRTQIPKRKKRIGNNILVGYSLLDTKMENYTEQYTNNKKETKELKLKWLRTAIHVVNFWHRPLRKITIKLICMIKRCSNHSITRIQNGKTKRQRTNTKKEEENWK